MDEKTKEALEYASFALKDILRFIAGEKTLSADPVAVAQQADKMIEEISKEKE